MNQFNFKIQKPIKGIKEENHYKNAISSLEEFPENGEEYGMEDGYLVKSLNDKIKFWKKNFKRQEKNHSRPVTRKERKVRPRKQIVRLNW